MPAGDEASSRIVDPTHHTLAMAILTGVAVSMAVTLYTMVRQPHLRPGLGGLLLVALPSQLISGTLLWVESSSRGIGPSYHQTPVDSCVCMLSCIGLLLAPLVLLHLFRAPKEERVPRPLTVAHAVVWVCTMALMLVLFLNSGF
ncbi:MAG: hypothetical protein IPL19_06520 [Sandaracinaceae bacterium]|nr:hypothetical protein [Sandaracinaceae bacterium]MBK8407626.1 hypothetical protein [Sandaracinaceae bacterium]